ncbi:phage portal protein family protein [Microbacterium sp. 22303]|uniref:phage portal protein family protein n=1 Tax=Microbacterium sp. 22303 TaxID=3453905 RepID=UPI003F828484
MTEIGYQADPGLLGWGTLFAWAAERNPDLQWPQSVEVFDRMRREDPQVKSVIRAVTLPILRTEWVIDGAGCRDEVTEHVARDLGLAVKGKPFVAPLRSKGRFSFKEFLRLALLELVYGHSFFEQVYTIDSFGLAHIGKLAWRPPRTIADIEVARDGGLVAIRQHGAGTSAPVVNGRAVLTAMPMAGVRIQVDRLVAFVNEREGANWLGESLLRAAYKMYVLKDRVLRIQALTAERNGLGVPVFTAPDLPAGSENWSFEEASDWIEQQIARGEQIAKEARAGEEAGVGLAHGSTLAFAAVTGRLPDTDKPIRYYDEQIAGAVLANFLSLGGDNATGSYALGETFASFFTDSLNAVAQHIAEVIQQHVIEDLVDANWGESEPAPRIVPAAIGEQQHVTAEVLKALIECGALRIDDSLRAYVRDRWGLPVEAFLEGTSSADAPSEAERAAAAVRAAQQGYLATDKPPLRQDEVRDLIRRAGADWLVGDGPDVSRMTTTQNPQPKEAA